MAYDVKIKGQEKVLRHLNQLANPKATFDKAILETAARSRAELADATLTKKSSSTSFQHRGETVVLKNLYTGDTSKAWSNPFKIDGGYMVTNDKKTANGKYLIAEMLEKGRGEIRPRTKKILYMPLSRKGSRKGYGEGVGGLEYGQDYILIKKAKAVKGRFFMKKIVNASSNYLTKEIINSIRKVFVA